MLSFSFKLDGILEVLKENKAYFKHGISFSLFFLPVAFCLLTEISEPWGRYICQ